MAGFGALIPLGFVAFWVVVCHIVSLGSGWWALSRAYRPAAPFAGKWRRGRSFRLNSANYNGCATLGTNADGLYLGVFFPFRPGHPPLFIPWADVSAQVVKGWFGFTYLEFTFARVPGVRLRILERQCRDLVADANRAWADRGE
ncbi:Uncharacterized protein OS=Myxococcus stipitatus (strain DSM 14675 / JCM 12634 / Mx s8) GN=MYSTI_03331 PE=4 SV=1 [Gemmataceae bacterium]|nr:Uncharacterized protein OS=Myxococcus stipitatus (strain DSM 14675 / JCM 12634 / Mx s8) GN=MYSTI_03331 PE=4 SV=1 [Gemmataceae bacterium]VTU01525.1 Uncharacterized protein OS=Myxococcus stipitatus (strain DSM 14675 / JCM 12634 / Mx s8) GN=MYSTI_03331 PE=4 SV=1 [Gemmataceae bacterium]